MALMLLCGRKLMTFRSMKTNHAQEAASRHLAANVATSSGGSRRSREKIRRSFVLLSFEFNSRHECESEKVIIPCKLWRFCILIFRQKILFGKTQANLRHCDRENVTLTHAHAFTHDERDTIKCLQNIFNYLTTYY